MANCPCCDANSISAAAKIWSGSASPVKCRACGQYAYVASMPFWFLGIGQLLLLAALLAAFLLWHWWPLVLFGAAVVGWIVWLGTSAPLLPVAAGDATRTRRIGNSVAVGVMVLGTAVYFVFRYAG